MTIAGKYRRQQTVSAKEIVDHERERPKLSDEPATTTPRPRVLALVLGSQAILGDIADLLWSHSPARATGAATRPRSPHVDRSDQSASARRKRYHASRSTLLWQPSV